MALEYIEVNGMEIEVNVDRRKATVYGVYDPDEAWEAIDHVPSIPEDHGTTRAECQAWADWEGAWETIEAAVKAQQDWEDEAAREADEERMADEARWAVNGYQDPDILIRAGASPLPPPSRP